jgi:hypothetical protein
MEHCEPSAWRGRRQLKPGIGRAYIYWIIALFSVLIVSPATAQTETGLHVIEWREQVYSANTLTGWDGDVVSVNLTRPHSWTVVNTTVDLITSFNVGISGSNAQRTFTMAVNGTDLSNCRHAITVEGTISEKRQAFGGGAMCPPGGEDRVLIGEEQTWTFDNTGSATVLFFHASVYAVVQETVTMDFTVETAFDFWLPLALLILVFAISLWQGYTLPMLISGIGVALEFFSTRPIDFVGIVYLLLIAFMLEYFVGGLRGLTKRRKDDDQNPW